MGSPPQWKTPKSGAAANLQSRTLRVASPDDTTEFATRLAPHLGAGDVILLGGGLGAGKTHFARAIIQARLPAPEDVPSPTFTLVQIYDAGDIEIWHADLYRLTDPDEAIELGFLEAFEEAICLVEWPDRLGEDAPDGALSLTFEMTDTDGARVVTADIPTDKWARKLDHALAK